METYYSTIYHIQNIDNNILVCLSIFLNDNSRWCFCDNYNILWYVCARYYFYWLRRETSKMSAVTFNGDCKLVDVKGRVDENRWRKIGVGWSAASTACLRATSGTFCQSPWPFSYQFFFTYHGSITGALVGFTYPAYATVARALWPPAATAESSGR